MVEKPTSSSSTDGTQEYFTLSPPPKIEVLLVFNPESAAYLFVRVQ